MKFTKLLRNKKAISPIFATLILIAIAVIAGIVVYLFTSGTIASMTGGGTAGSEKVSVQAVTCNATTDTIAIWGKSTGGTDVIIDGLIIKDSGGATLEVAALATTTTLPASGTLTTIDLTGTTMSTDYVAGNSYTVTITSVDGGNFVSAAFEGVS
jgi:flagellin-like protein